MARSSTLSAGDALGHQRPHGVDDLGPAAVVEGHGEGQGAVGLGELDRLVHAAQHPPRDPPVPPPGEADAHALFVQLVAPAHQQGLVEPHEVADLVGGPPPVLGGEGVHGEPPDPDLEAPVDHVEQRRLTGGVALGPRQVPPAGPPAVAVHDTGHVGRHPAPVELGRHRVDRRVGTPGLGGAGAVVPPGTARALEGSRHDGKLSLPPRVWKPGSSAKRRVSCCSRASTTWRCSPTTPTG